MATYYVFIPATELPTAEVTASSTKHARTAYLDYLTRSGQFPYSQRGAMRDAIIAKSSDPGEYPTDLKLEYGITEPVGSEVEEVPIPNTVEQLRSEGYYPGDEPLTPEEEAIGEEYKRFEEERGGGSTNPFGNSPIMNLSKQSGGM